MASLSFLDDCHDCLERGHKSWESYFSKWDLLAKNEEAITESGLVEELNTNIDPKKGVNKTKNINKGKVNKGKKKEPIQKAKNSKKLCLRSSANKLSLRNKRTQRLRRVQKEPPKKKKTRKVKKLTQNLDIVKTNGSVQDESDTKQLEVDLKTVFMSILRENKTKWEIFSVLSQTISRDEMKINTYHKLNISPKLANGVHSRKCFSFTSQEIVPLNVSSLNKLKISPKLANGVHSRRCLSFTSQEIVPLKVSSSSDNLTIVQNKSLDVALNSSKSPNRIEILGGREILNNLRSARDSVSPGDSDLNQTFPLDNIKKVDYSCVSPCKPLEPFYLPPKVDFNMINKISKGIYDVKNLTHSYLNNSQNESEKRLKPLPLDLSGTSEGSEGSKININKLSFLKARFSDVPQINVRREKTFQNLCLHKRTGDVSLNMRNSNFVTPKRNPPERKCFSENILQRKKRARSKLSFFDYVQDDDDSDSDDPSENRSPVIRWESKKAKIDEIKIDDSDSDDLESIFDRVRKP